MTSKLLYPERDFGLLFHDVQTSGIFADSKTFSDAECTLPPEDILAIYGKVKDNPDFNLKDFVSNYFTMRAVSDGNDITTSRDIVTHIKGLWQQLKREDKNAETWSSKIRLPHPYVVPGGRFDEIYYWDSYFTMLGLIECGEQQLALDMHQNFAYMIENWGFIPNGNRSYYLSRSQPPFFCLMAKLMKDNELIKEDINHLNLLTREYEFWQSKAIEFNYDEVHTLHMFRYYDTSDTPRDESYAEDLELYNETQNESIYSHIRSACESGWDFSSRWFADKKSLNTIRTAYIFPIDLNCIMAFVESELARLHDMMNNYEEGKKYLKWSQERINVIQTIFFDDSRGFFDDVDVNGQLSGNNTLAGMFPLYFGYASKIQSESCIKFLTKHLLAEGGLVTSDVNSGQQWDAPNGWAPLQFITVSGLLNMGYDDLAFDIMERWCRTIANEFDRTGKLMEKYNVVTPDVNGGGGEYPNQDGFGWTNAVYIIFKNKLKNRKEN